MALAAGVSHTAINKRAKKDGWVRDPEGQDSGQGRIAGTQSRGTQDCTQSDTAISERQIIEANAERIAQG